MAEQIELPPAGMPLHTAAVAGMLQRMWRDIGSFSDRVAAARSYAERARDAATDAIRLLGEDADAAEILDADMLAAALAPPSAGQGDPSFPYDATLAAAATLFDTLSSGSPRLEGSFLAARHLISTVFALGDRNPPEALRGLQSAFDREGPFFKLVHCFRVGAPMILHVQEGDQTWEAWTREAYLVKQFSDEALKRMRPTLRALTA
uniref:Uncharacterized protein n=1 Tax=Leersia perrieri TaxID=77586 RepID=A0A0D9VVC0_9ORYZ